MGFLESIILVIDGLVDQLEVEVHLLRAQAKKDKEEAARKEKTQKKNEEDDRKKWKDNET